MSIEKGSRELLEGMLEVVTEKRDAEVERGNTERGDQLARLASKFSEAIESVAKLESEVQNSAKSP